MSMRKHETNRKMTRPIRAVAGLATLALVTSVAGCAGSGAGGDSSSSGERITVGVAMPTQTSERWIADGEAIQAGLEELGYEVDLQYGDDDIPAQTEQVDQMITNGVDLLIIGAIDGTALSSQIEAAEQAGIPVIAYDRLLMNSDGVDFYVTFDNYDVGAAQAVALLYGLGITDREGNRLSDEPSGPYNIELFAGSPDDNNVQFNWSGAMDVLQPYLDDGTLVVHSGQTELAQCYTERWSQEAAQERMENILSQYYSDGTVLDGVLSQYDGMSRGIITALQGTGGLGPTVSEGLPIVTGQDAEIATVKLISDDEQHSTIFKDTRKLADQAVIAAESFINGEEPEANNTTDYDNGNKIVPSYLLTVDTVYADNIESLLIDSEYFTEEEVQTGVLSEDE